MSFSALNWAWEQDCSSGVAKSVLVYLANCASQEGGDCYPSVPKICKRVQHTELAVRKALRELARDSLIEIAPQFAPNGRQRSNLYRLAVVALATPSNPQGYADAPASAPDDDAWSPPWANEPEPDTPAESHPQTPAESHPTPPAEPTPPTPADSRGNPSLDTDMTPLPVHSPSPRAKKARADVGLFTQEWQAAFEAFYAAYPRKCAVDRARKAFFTRMREGVRPAEIMEGLARYEFRTRTRYRPYPATWLNGGSWKDDLEQTADDDVLAAVGLTAEPGERAQRPMLFAIGGGRS